MFNPRKSGPLSCTLCGEILNKEEREKLRKRLEGDIRQFDPTRDKFWAEYYRMEEHSKFIPGSDFCRANGEWKCRCSSESQGALREWLDERSILKSHNMRQGS